MIHVPWKNGERKSVDSRRTLNYKKLNNLLLGCIILINAYVLTAPFWPQLTTWWQLNNSNTRAVLQQRIDHPIKPLATAKPQPNQLIAPDMGLSATIGEGSYAHRYDVLKNGIWRYDRGSTPDRGGNTVLAGHRFTYTNPRGVFYALDRLHVGSQLALSWNNRQYNYRVSEIKVVDPSDVDIQSQTKDSRLTLFTCTPLWHPTSRLVVTATLETRS